jgi:hypothetical protein
VRYISVCSGIEAATVGWKPLGWEAVAFAEIDSFPSAVLAHHYPDIPNLGDISKVDWRPYLGTVDLVVGGTPCQSFSVAGNRDGLDGASGLVREYFRLLREVRPRWFVWENVPPEPSPLTKEMTSNSFSGNGTNSGIMSRGVFLTLNTSEYPSDAVESSLSDILETGVVPSKYFLSRQACEGIIRRAEKRGKALPPILKAALERTAKESER